MPKYPILVFLMVCLATPALNGKSGPPELTLAWTALDRMDWAGAAGLFQQAIESPQIPAGSRAEALYGLGLSEAYATPPRVKEALAAFHQVGHDYPAEACAGWAALEGVMLKGRADQLESAAQAEALMAVIRAYPGQPVIHEATLRAAMCLLEAGQGDQAMNLLNDHLQQEPDNTEAPLMRFLIAYWRMEVDENYVDALPILLELAEHNLAEPRRRAMVLWAIAQIYRLHKDDPQTALAWYRRIVSEYPNEVTTGDARRMIQQLEGQL